MQQPSCPVGYSHLRCPLRGIGTFAAAQSQLGPPAFEDRVFLNKILGLSNLYYIDPEDQEILQELREVRLQTVQLMLSVNVMSWASNSKLILVIVSGPWHKVAYKKKAWMQNEVQQRDAMQRG